jgi:hypothetical protein
VIMYEPLYVPEQLPMVLPEECRIRLLIAHCNTRQQFLFRICLPCSQFV